MNAFCGARKAVSNGPLAPASMLQMDTIPSFHCAIFMNVNAIKPIC